jgi:hypothetical protein
MLSLISFEAGRRTQTLSSGQPQELRPQTEVWFSIGEPNMLLPVPTCPIIAALAYSLRRYEIRCGQA